MTPHQMLNNNVIVWRTIGQLSRHQVREEQQNDAFYKIYVIHYLLLQMILLNFK